MIGRGVRRPPPTMHDRLRVGDWARLGYLARYRLTGDATLQQVGVVKQVHGQHRQARVDLALAPPHGVVRVTQDDIAERAWLDDDGTPSSESTEGPPRIWAHLHQGR